MGFFSKSLDQVVNEKRRLKINGVRFEIKKIDPIDHIKGLNIMRAEFETYQNKPDTLSAGAIKKIREHYRHVFIAGVISPSLSLKESDDGVCVDDIFKDQNLTEKLYAEIICFTYGKKKLFRKVFQT